MVLLLYANARIGSPERDDDDLTADAICLALRLCSYATLFSSTPPYRCSVCPHVCLCLAVACIYLVRIEEREQMAVSEAIHGQSVTKLTSRSFADCNWRFLAASSLFPRYIQYSYSQNT